MICEEAVFRVIEDINGRLNRAASYDDILDEMVCEWKRKWGATSIERAIRKLAEKGHIERYNENSKRACWRVSYDDNRI
jgi:predicted transcriptional regulator